MNRISSIPAHWSFVEPLESRIAPAAVTPLLDESAFKAITMNTPIFLHAGEGLSTGGPNSGAYLLYVTKGTAEIFTTDLNKNGKFDFNEITGIAAGDGLQMISFVDIHGDIVTNLNSDGTLSDSDSDASNGRDGRVLLNSRIEMIQMRSLEKTDIAPSNPSAKVASDADVALHAAISSHSIYGGIYAGAGFGLSDGSGGLWFGAGSDGEAPSVGPIKVGTAASGQHFSFGNTFGGPIAPSTGNSNANSGGDIQGTLMTFRPNSGQAGADINGIHALPGTDGATTFNISTLQAGDGGFGAAGGSISNVTLPADNSGGYKVIAGNGGRGLTGGAGGSIVNFSDLGSITSSVYIKAGDGGQGLTGAGGGGGSISFGTMNVAGAVTMQTGSGGDGFTNGGNGASFLTGVFSTPDGVALPTGGALVTTTRNLDPVAISTVGGLGTNPNPVPGKPSNFWAAIPSIGQTQAIDFNHDGYADLVFTTSNPDQVVVLFGSASGGYDFSKTIFLDAPVNPGAITVGDFNNDGHPDIAVAASSDSFSGVSVFLSQYNGVDSNGVHDQFSGFSDALQSAFPVMTTPETSNGVGTTQPFTWDASKTQVLRMVVGDFNGDGVNELAVQLKYTEVAGQSLHIPLTATKLLYLNNDLDEHGFGTGYFYANFGTTDLASLSPFYPSDAPAFGQLTQDEIASVATGPMKASAYTYNNIYNYGAARQDYVFVTYQGAANKGISVYDNHLPSLFGPTSLAASPDWVDEAHGFILGNVDTDRKYPEGTNTHISASKAGVGDFALLDVNHDNIMDLVALTSASSQGGFLVAFEGSGSTPFLTKVSSPNGDQNAGISIAGRDPAGAAPAGLAFSGDLNFTNGSVVGIVAADPTGAGLFDGVGVVKTGGDVPQMAVEEISFTNVDTLPGPTASPVIHSVTGTFAMSSNEDLSPAHNGSYAFDLSFTSSTSSVHSYGAMLEEQLITGNGGFVEYASFFYNFTTGSGGNGVVGSGGSGGNLGGGHLGKTTSSLTGTSFSADIQMDFTFPTTKWVIEPGPAATGWGSTLVTGNGGSGFINGGSAGGVSGVIVEGNYLSDLITGNGGNGFLGTGGNGGGISANHIDPASSMTTGNGGDGSTGGNGGSITGNKLPLSDQFFDAYSPTLYLTTGNGGHGIKRGGDGGNIQSFATQFYQTDFIDNSGLSYHAGSGGDAVSGPGGSGGSVINSSPVSAVNWLRGDIDIVSGTGGNGLSGGVGGSISNVVNSPSDPSVLPGLVSLVAGNGGNGISGSGGTGGGIDTVTIAGHGLGTSVLKDALFNRVVSGAGGISMGSAGGSGGSVTAINVTAQSGAMVVASGAGGVGLTSGGTGGSIANALVNSSGNDPRSGSSIGKVVAIAGDGGDTIAALPFNHSNPSSLPSALDNIKSFGGVNGRGGNGGSITNFQQPASVKTNVDLIAGNGGSTLNYGNSDPGTVVNVGKGGSISGATVIGADGSTRANIYGNIGNSDPDVAIKAYNNIVGDYHADETMAQFVQDTFRDYGMINTNPINDDLGNVGLVAGAAGKAMNGVTVTGGTNGSVSNLVLLNSDSKILSMVAGAVDNIAKIQSISGLRLANGGGVPSNNLGADKEVVPAGSSTTPEPGSNPPTLGVQYDYYDLNGLVVNDPPQTGFGLIDGVIFASNTNGLLGHRVVQA